MPALKTTVFYQPFIGFTYTESKWILLKFFLFWIITRTSECLMPISTVPSPTEWTENGSTSTDLLNHSRANDCCRTGEWTAAQLSPWCGDCLCVLCMVTPTQSPIHSLPYICEYPTGHINIKGKIFHMYFSCSNFRAFIGVDIRRAVGQVSLT